MKMSFDISIKKPDSSVGIAGGEVGGLTPVHVYRSTLISE